MFTVGDLSRLTGVTVRALHHYDEVGLCRPSARSPAGYRLYSDADVVRLQQVLLFRELGMPLTEIAVAIDGAPHELLRRHREVLLVKRARLDAMIAALDKLEKGSPMQPEDVKSMFDGFDHTAYEDEAREKWGATPEFAESQRRTRGYTKDDWQRMKQEMDAIYQGLAAQQRAGAAPDAAAVQELVERHRLHIDHWFYPCSVEMQRRLGEMYVADPRFTANLDKIAPGFAGYLRDAIAGRALSSSGG